MARLVGGVPREGRRPLVVEDALAYLERVRARFADGREHAYNTFLDIMKDFKASRSIACSVAPRSIA